MEFSILSLILAFSCMSSEVAAKYTGTDAFARIDKHNHNNPTHHENIERRSAPPTSKRQSSPYLNENTQKFVVDGTAIPEVNFDIGESYAGLLPISQAANETRQLFFWFFPSSNPEATDEITIWFNGGPGCSSFSGLLTENGPFLWQSGTLAPTQNSYSWTNLTNMMWIEQPVGVGFTQGTPNITNEVELADEFVGFYRNFVNAFTIHGRKLYLTGESYAGFYVPYIADAFISAEDPDWALSGIAINDPIIGDGTLQQQVPVVPYVDYWSELFYLNSSATASIHEAADKCNYTAYFDQHLAFPPPSPFAPIPDEDVDGCDLFDAVYTAAQEQNPCFNIYHITDTCPFLYSQLGIVNQGDYSPPGAAVYFNRTDVQQAINAPVGTDWQQCTRTNVFGQGSSNQTRRDQSPGPSLNGVLQRVIEHTNNTIIGSGDLDYILTTNGTMLAVQNMTWNGVQGFQTDPRSANEFYVPFHPEYNGGSLSGAGVVGYWGTERGLTFYTVQLAGHELPGYSLGAGYRSLELLLGRISSLSENSTTFTTLPANSTGSTQSLSRREPSRYVPEKF